MFSFRCCLLFTLFGLGVHYPQRSESKDVSRLLNLLENYVEKKEQMEAVSTTELKDDEIMNLNRLSDLQTKQLKRTSKREQFIQDLSKLQKSIYGLEEMLPAKRRTKKKRDYWCYWCDYGSKIVVDDSDLEDCSDTTKPCSTSTDIETIGTAAVSNTQ